MALQATRLVFRLVLSNVDRGVEREEPVNVARHPSETQDHVVLRMLAWCLLWQEGLEFGPGLSIPDTPDLWARDLTGRLVSWIECRAVESERLKKIVNGAGGTQVTFLVDSEKRAREMKQDLDGWKRVPANVSIHVVDHALVAGLAASEQRQQKWRVTVVGDHFYVDADGQSLDGAVTKVF
jgi:uncharacterized protein YaeQ